MEGVCHVDLLWSFSLSLDCTDGIVGADIGFALAIDSPSLRSWATSRILESIA